MISYLNLRSLNKRATLDQNMLYKHSLQLHKVYNLREPFIGWLTLNFMQTLTSRQTTFYALKSNNYKVGTNLLFTGCNKEPHLATIFHVLNSIPIIQILKVIKYHNDCYV